MTIEELKKTLDSIPPTSSINKARRAQIRRRIREIEKEKAGK